MEPDALEHMIVRPPIAENTYEEYLVRVQDGRFPEHCLQASHTTYNMLDLRRTHVG